MRGVALGLLAQTNHIPLLKDYIQQILRITIGAHGREFKAALKASRLKYAEAHPENLCAESDDFICTMYGVTSEHLKHMRDVISRMDAPGFYGDSLTLEFWRLALDIENG